jgi:hypothetical protein
LLFRGRDRGASADRPPVASFDDSMLRDEPTDEQM